MKKVNYIRTKDNRIICVTDFDIDLETNCYVKGDIKIKLSDAIKGTEQLGELCDKLVVVVQNEEPIILIHKRISKALFNKLKLDGGKIYAAIWTEWGLKYVAYLNNEEKWELL